MRRDRQLPLLGGRVTDPVQGEPQQWRGRHIESGTAVLGEPLRQRRLPVLGGQTGEVHLPPGDGHLVQHQLDRPAVGGGGEGHPQVVVTIEHGLGGRAQPLDLQCALERDDRLLAVHIDGGLGHHRVEQQTRLQRRQRPHLGQARVLPLPATPLVRIDLDQRTGRQFECAALAEFGRRGQGRDGAAFEDVAGAEMHTLDLRPRHQLQSTGCCYRRGRRSRRPRRPRSMPSTSPNTPPAPARRRCVGAR